MADALEKNRELVKTMNDEIQKGASIASTILKYRRELAQLQLEEARILNEMHDQKKSCCCLF